MQAENNSSDLFDSLKCPITYELFRDPVIGSDGHTYERENITVWIKKNGRSPITREPMDLKSLRSNYIVKKMVEDFAALSLQKQYQFRLDVDVCKSNSRPIFQSSNKTIYEAKWMLKHGPPIVLIKIDGAKAKYEASFYVKLSCHPHIVRTYGLVDSNSPNSSMLVQEYAPEGDLNRLFREKKFQPTMEILLEIFSQIVDAMICLADNQIIHGDLACRNVLVFRSSSNQPTEFLVKLTDFGLTQASSLFSVVDSPTSTTIKVIPIRSVAPEILRDTSATSYSEKSDVYSFGTLMWEACSKGATPYGDVKSSDDVLQERLRGKLLERPSACADELWDIIVNCTQQIPQKRPNFKTIQEDLLRLRFQNRRESVNRTSQMDSMYMNIPNRTSSITSGSDGNLPPSSHGQFYANLPIYNNLNMNLDKCGFSQSNNPHESMCQYYIPCEYCEESINNDHFDKHKDVCSVRIIAKSLAKVIAQLPLLEVTSCQFCDNLIPLNMLNIHQKTCTKNSPCVNESQTWLQKAADDSYVSCAYLKPVLPPHPPSEHRDYEYAKHPDGPMQRSTSTFTIESELFNQASADRASTTNISRKSPKSGFRRVFSKLKKKMTP